MAATLPGSAPAPQVRLFGRAELRAAVVLPFTAQRRFLLLALLALRSGEWLPRDAVGALFWPDHGTSDARRNLRKLVFEARTVAGAQDLQANEHALRWDVGTDLQAFRAALETGRLADAIALRRGPLLDGLAASAHPALEEAFAAERARLDHAWHAAALSHLHTLADPQARSDAAARLLDVDPLDEAAIAAVIAAELARGRRADALAVYRRYAERLAAALGVEPALALRQLLQEPGAAVPTQPAANAAMAASAAPDPGQFVGRRVELIEIGRLLDQPDCRLLTVLGPGGIGKSRFVQHWVAHHLPAAGPPWRRIALEALADVAQVAAQLAQTFDVAVGSGADALEPLLRRLQDGRWRVVLDNAEHLAGLPALLRRLLDAAPGLQLLVTSRTRLLLAGEWVFPLAGLATPDEDSRDLELAARFDAVRLFDVRARAARHDFHLERHLGAVLAIVDAVAGMPLALELAASWVRLLPPETIAQDLRGSIDLLEHDPANAAPLARPEHTSLRAVLDRAWALLAPPERRALAALSVFRGGFTRAAAQAVAGGSMPLLSSLVDKSLVGVGEDGRFGLHPLVAAHAAEQLAATPDDQARAEIAHAEYHARALARLAPFAIGDQRRLVAGVAAEHANAVAAWLTALRRGRADLLADMVRALWAFYENRGRQHEGLGVLGPALVATLQGPAADLARARLCHGLSMLHHRVGDQAQGLAIARSGFECAEACGDTEAWVGCVLNAGSCHWQAGDAVQARALFERAVAIARARADRQCLAWALGNLGVVLTSLGQLGAARDTLQQALAGSREAGDQYNVAVHLVNLGALERDAGDLTASRRRLEEGAEHCAEHGIVTLALYVALNLGHVLRRRGDWAGARARYAEALALAPRSGSRLIEWSVELGLAFVDAAEGRHDAALGGLRRLLPPARAAASMPELATAALVYGDVLAAQGDAAAAAAAWSAAKAAGVLSAATQEGLGRRLAELPPELQSASVPTLDAVLDRLAG